MSGQFWRRPALFHRAEHRSIAATISLILVIAAPWAMVATALPSALNGGPTNAPQGPVLSELSSTMLGAVTTPLTVSLTLTPTSIVEGSPVSADVQVSPSTGSPWSLAWSGLPSPCSSTAPTTTSSDPLTWSCNPSTIGSYTFGLQVTNATNVTGSTTAQLTVVAPLATNMTLSAGSVTLGGMVTFYYEVTGGFSPYALQWTSLPTPCSGSAPTTTSLTTLQSWTCTPTQTFSGSITLHVSDSNSPTDSASSSGQPLSVNAVPLHVLLSLSSSSVTVSSTVKISYTVTGGESPYTLQWMGLPSSCTGPAPSTVSDNAPHSWDCIPSQSGNTQISVQVTDSARPTQASVTSLSSALNVNSNNNNNNNNNGNGSNGGGKNGSNSNGSFQLPSFLSNLGSLFLIAALLALVAFILLIIIAVSTLVTAVMVARRLPPRSRGETKEASVPCPACGAASPAKAKFCPACGKPMTAPATPA